MFIQNGGLDAKYLFYKHLFFDYVIVTSVILK